MRSALDLTSQAGPRRSAGYLHATPDGSVCAGSRAIKEAMFEPDDPQVTAALGLVGICVREVGRLGGAEELFQGAMELQEAKLGLDDVQVSPTLQELGRYARETGRLGEAQALFRRELGIKEAKLRADDTQVTLTLQELGRCTEDVGGPAETEERLTHGKSCTPCVSPFFGPMVTTLTSV